MMINWMGTLVGMLGWRSVRNSTLFLPVATVRARIYPPLVLLEGVWTGGEGGGSTSTSTTSATSPTTSNNNNNNNHARIRHLSSSSSSSSSSQRFYGSCHSFTTINNGRNTNQKTTTTLSSRNRSDDDDDDGATKMVRYTSSQGTSSTFLIDTITDRVETTRRMFWSWSGGWDVRGGSLSSSSSSPSSPVSPSEEDNEESSSTSTATAMDKIINVKEEEEKEASIMKDDQNVVSMATTKTATSSSSVGSTTTATTTTTTSTASTSPSLPFTPYQVSACTAQGYRTYMEDEFFLSLDGDFAAVFDGHGGRAISRYLRQNLYANLQALLPTTTRPAATTATARMSTVQSVTLNDNSNDNSNASSSNSVMNETTTTNSSSGGSTTSSPSAAAAAAARDNMEDLSSTIPKRVSPTVQDYENAMFAALDKVDREVQRISHWSYQGSTAVVVWVHEERKPSVQEEEGEEEPERQQENVEQLEKSPADELGDGSTTTTTKLSSSMTQQQQQQQQQQLYQRTIIAANVGDSRAILCRNGTAWDLTRDHKPNDPYEQERIEQLGGKVVWCGDVDKEGQPILEQGIYRVNGNLALSRAIGDRSERPWVTAEPEIISVEVQEDTDEFILVASDGLWDVMDSQDAVDYVNSLRTDGRDQDKIATMVVEEALRLGTYDNITVLIIWLTRESI